eukprot:scaffold733_cov129-Isochrysis_galbana.AAC.1
MAPRRPDTQLTEADPTLDIGAKRARVEGEDERIELPGRVVQILRCSTDVALWYGGTPTLFTTI